MTITLREITEDNTEAVLGVRTTPAQEQFVSTVAYSLKEAVEFPQGNPWYRAVYADDQPVGFVMLSWDVEPQPPEINGPWFLWKLIVDHRHQGKGYGREIVRQVVEIVRREGGTELLTSHVPGEGGPAGFYARLGFVPRGDVDQDGEIILRLRLPDEGPFFHGTKADLQVGGLLAPGYSSNYGSRGTANFVYFTATLDAATWGAELAVGEGRGSIYRVEPTGAFEDDPNLTDQRFPGNPTRSYRTQEPLRVLEVVEDWEGHSPEQLRAMHEHLDELKRQGIEAVNE